MNDPHEGKTREELIAELEHMKQCVLALGDVLEKFSIVVLLSVERMSKAQGVMGTVSNPWG